MQVDLCIHQTLNGSYFFYTGVAVFIWSLLETSSNEGYSHNIWPLNCIACFHCKSYKNKAVLDLSMQTLLSDLVYFCHLQGFQLYWFSQLKFDCCLESPLCIETITTFLFHPFHLCLYKTIAWIIHRHMWTNVFVSRYILELRVHPGCFF